MKKTALMSRKPARKKTTTASTHGLTADKLMTLRDTTVVKDSKGADIAVAFEFECVHAITAQAARSFSRLPPASSCRLKRQTNCRAISRNTSRRKYSHAFSLIVSSPSA